MRDDSAGIESVMADIGTRARAAARLLAQAPSALRHEALLAMAATVRRAEADILAANAQDVAQAREAGLSAALIDRLVLDKGRIAGIASGIEAVAALPDPVGAVIDAWTRPNGLRIERVRTPLGVIGVIYESRPNVTADAGALCLASGNAVILRGGSDLSLIHI